MGSKNSTEQDLLPIDDVQASMGLDELTFVPPVAEMAGTAIPKKSLCCNLQSAKARRDINTVSRKHAVHLGRLTHRLPVAAEGRLKIHFINSLLLKQMRRQHFKQGSR